MTAARVKWFAPAPVLRPPGYNRGVKPLIRLVQEHRRALARVVMAVGTTVVLLQFWPLVEPLVSPDTVVELDLGPEHAKDGAPARVQHRVSLPTGELELQCVVRGRDGASHMLTRKLRTTAGQRVRISIAGWA
jgi:hypothetical protein